MAKLLVIDDSPDVAQLISEMLRREGYEVEVSFDGRQAIDMIGSGQEFDVILTDLIMPELDGVGLIHQLREMKNETPVLVLSGGGVTINSSDALKSVEGLATDVLQKPVKYEELLEKVRSVLS
ncbi:MAG: response regulator [Alphaproteobacteria bacterium]